MRKWDPDKNVSGLGILTLPSGVQTWYLRYRDKNGRQLFQKIGRVGVVNRTTARSEALKMLGDVANGVEKFSDKTSVLKFSIMLQHRHYQSLRKTTRKGYACYWRKDVLPAMGDLPVASVTRPQILELLAPMSNVKANRILQMLKAAFNQAEIWGLRPENSNPCKRIKKHPEQMRRRYLDGSEVDQLLAACDEFGRNDMRWRFAQMIKLLLFTGARRGEIMAARWDWVDWSNAVLVVPPEHHKTGADGHQRTIYLSQPALDVLRQLQKRSISAYIIQGRGDAPLVGARKMWLQLLSIAGMSNLHIHDLRHAYASLAVTAGLSLPQIGGLLGHASPVTTARYAHLIDKTAAASAAKVAALLK